MAHPVLAVDLGANTTGAALVSGERAMLVRDPISGAPAWPSLLGFDGGLYLAGAAAGRAGRAAPGLVVEGPRRALDTETMIPLGDGLISPMTGLAAFLGSLRTEASRLCPDPVERLTVAAPATYPVPDRRRELLIAAGELAGFREVELVNESVAAAMEARANGAVADGSLVLVCDLGETWSTSLVRVAGPDPVQLAQETAFAGRDLEAMLLDDVRAQARDWLEPRLATQGPLGLLARRDAVDMLRRVRSGLAGSVQMTDRLGDGGPLYTLSRAWLGRLAEPGLRWLVASCRGLLARSAAGLGASGGAPLGGALGDVAAVILIGGGAHLPGAEQILRTGLDRPVLLPPEPELAVVRGAVAWVAEAPQRRIRAEHSKWRVEHLAWTVPGGRARLVRWSVDEGEAYSQGTVVAQVRTPDDRVYDLATPCGGVLMAPRARVGEIVGPTLLVASKRPASCLDGDLPEKLRELSAQGEWLLTPDRRLLVECAAGGERVRLRSIPDGAVVGECQPTFADGEDHGRVFVNPDGRLCMVAWSQAGAFSVWDVRSGQRLVGFREGGQPLAVRVNEEAWRLTVQAEDAGSAGRYRRSVATVWDLSTGRRLEKLAADRQPPGYRDRSAVDGFGDDAVSPDGRLHAVPLRTAAGATGVALQAATTEQEVFRAEHPHSPRVRMAFTADGHYLLTNWDSDQRSQVDVWEL